MIETWTDEQGVVRTGHRLYRLCSRGALYGGYCGHHVVLLTGGSRPERNPRPEGKCLWVVKAPHGEMRRLDGKYH